MQAKYTRISKSMDTPPPNNSQSGVTFETVSREFTSIPVSATVSHESSIGNNNGYRL